MSLSVCLSESSDANRSQNMYGLIENASLTSKASAMVSSFSSFGGRPAYYKIPSANVSHLHLDLPQLKMIKRNRLEEVVAVIILI